MEDEALLVNDDREEKFLRQQASEEWEVMEEAGTKPSFFNHLISASWVSKVLLVANMLSQMLFTGIFFVQKDYQKAGVSQVPWYIYFGFSICLVLMVAITALIFVLSYRQRGPSAARFQLLFYISSFGFSLLFANWFGKFIIGVAKKVQDHSLSSANEVVLSGFIQLLVYSGDAYTALEHLSEIELRWREFIPVVLIDLSVVALVLFQRMYEVDENSMSVLLFETGLTFAMVVLHLYVVVLQRNSHKFSKVIFWFCIVFAILCLAALLAVFVLAVYVDYVADIMQRCVDVALLLEAHIVRKFQLRINFWNMAPLNRKEMETAGKND